MIEIIEIMRKQLMKHPLTEQGIEKFQTDYKVVFGE